MGALDLFLFQQHEQIAQWSDEALAASSGWSVRVQCLTSAVLNREPYGVWGGTTEDDRRRPLGQAAPTAQQHRQDGAAA